MLRNTIQEYAWGSRTAIPELLGLASPAAMPQAELWMGAHPKAPSRALVDGEEIPLPELIRRDPPGMLGRAVARRFAGELPFLFKVIAAAAPLSIQVHPNAEQAREGFRRENQAGIPVDAFERNYRDRNHKPELLVALTPFWALNGFRPIGEVAARLGAAAPRGLAGEVEALAADPSPGGLQGLFAALMRLPEGRRARVLDEAAAWASAGPEEDGGVDNPAAAGPGQSPTLGPGRSPALGPESGPGRGPAPRAATQAEIRRWLLRIREHYPGDVGVLAPLFLNLVELQPGGSMFLHAGVAHAYLEGTGIELMANSDNVLRGGLTPKHVDVPELLRTLRFESTAVERPVELPRPGGETVFRTPAREFQLSEIRPPQGREYRSAARRNVEILLCVSGSAELVTVTRRSAPRQVLTLPQGTAVVVPAAAPAYRLGGRARLFKATVP